MHQPNDRTTNKHIPNQKRYGKGTDYGKGDGMDYVKGDGKGVDYDYGKGDGKGVDYGKGKGDGKGMNYGNGMDYGKGTYHGLSNVAWGKLQPRSQPSRSVAPDIFQDILIQSGASLAVRPPRLVMPPIKRQCVDKGSTS